MDPKDFRQLALTGSVSDGDTRPRITTLSALPGGFIEARSQGSYAAAGARVVGDLPASATVAVASAKLIGVANMFYRAKLPVTLEVGAYLAVSNGLSRQTIPLIAEFEPVCPAPFVPSVEVDIGEMKREIKEVGSSIATAMTTPIFAGMHLLAGEGRLGLETNNGYSLAVQSAVEAAGDGELDVVVNVTDFKRALMVVTGTAVNIGHDGTRLLLTNEESWVSVSLMADGAAWPRIPFPPVAELGQRVEIPTKVLKEAVQASSLYPSARIILRPGSSSGEWGKVVIETEDMGGGQYQQVLEGRMVSPAYLGPSEVAILAKAAQLPTVTLHLDHQRGLALLGERRRALLTFRYEPPV